MIKPNLSDFSDFVEKPKPVIHKSMIDIKKEQTMYMNIILIIIVLIGIYYLYYRIKEKEKREKQAQQKIKELDDYMNDYLMNNMLNQYKYDNMLNEDYVE